MRPKVLFIIYLCFIILLSGCATVRKDLKKGIPKKELTIGMSKSEVKRIMGEPASISSFSHSSGGSEVWIYGDCPPKCSILYFGNKGTLNSISHKK